MPSLQDTILLEEYLTSYPFIYIQQYRNIYIYIYDIYNMYKVIIKCASDGQSRTVTSDIEKM